MKKLFVFLTVLILMMCARYSGNMFLFNSVNAQYRPHVDHYVFNFKLLTDSEAATVTPDTTLNADSTYFTFSFMRGEQSTPPYISPFTGEQTFTLNATNTPEMWSNDSAATRVGELTLPEGIYEITVNEYVSPTDVGLPGSAIFIFIEDKQAHVIILYRVE